MLRAGDVLAQLAASAKAKRVTKQAAHIIQGEVSVSALTAAARRYSAGGAR